MPHTIRFDKLRLSFLYILIPVSIALTISVGSLVFFVMDQLHIKIEPAVTFLNPVVALGYLFLSLSIIFLYLKPHTRWKIISGRIIAGIVFLFSVFLLYFLNFYWYKLLHLKLLLAIPLDHLYSKNYLTLETQNYF